MQKWAQLSNKLFMNQSQGIQKKGLTFVESFSGKRFCSFLLMSNDVSMLYAPDILHF
jgi:hypothetical protein